MSRKGSVDGGGFKWELLRLTDAHGKIISNILSSYRLIVAEETKRADWNGFGGDHIRG
jgi:hypothetical protein